ncbi:MAG TPA: hypothetical protein PK014_07445 [Thermoanaerobaculia bacterium]|nr:hypothetical protein [Thermoanaerobaculia bacterium]HUM29919.1 hypothetical protein [Thermoanaerobaculia bacterium]HXK68214.1 hypothetical protein [Thermoanaerobaculia bacterium]
MSVYLRSGIVSPFVTSFSTPEWLLRSLLDEILDRSELPLGEVDTVFVATNTVLNERITEHFHEDQVPFVTVNSPRCPVGRALYLAHRLMVSAEVSTVAIITVSIPDRSLLRTLQREGDNLAQQFSLDRNTLDDWSFQSAERYVRHTKAAVSFPWSYLLVEPTTGITHIQDTLLGHVLTRETLTEMNLIFPEPYTVVTEGNTARPAVGGGAILLSKERDGALLELEAIEHGHAGQKLASLSSLMALPHLLSGLEKLAGYGIPEWTASHVLSMLRLMRNDTFCESYLGLKNCLMESSDHVNPPGGDLAYGWAPGPAEMRHLLTFPVSSGERFILLLNDVPGQGFALRAKSLS